MPSPAPAGSDNQAFCSLPDHWRRRLLGIGPRWSEDITGHRKLALLRMQGDGLITLPPSRMPGGRSKPHFPATPASDEQAPVMQPVHELAPLTLRLVAGTAASRLWNEYVQRHHYLGYTPMAGAQLRYNVYCGEQLVALISFGASAWKLAHRERFIGWQEHQRKKNLQQVVNNARFLILP